MFQYQTSSGSVGNFSSVNSAKEGGGRLHKSSGAGAWECEGSVSSRTGQEGGYVGHVTDKGGYVSHVTDKGGYVGHVTDKGGYVGHVTDRKVGMWVM